MIEMVKDYRIALEAWINRGETTQLSKIFETLGQSTVLTASLKRLILAYQQHWLNEPPQRPDSGWSWRLGRLDRLLVRFSQPDTDATVLESDIKHLMELIDLSKPPLPQKRSEH